MEISLTSANVIEAHQNLGPCHDNDWAAKGAGGRFEKQHVIPPLEYILTSKNHKKEQVLHEQIMVIHGESFVSKQKEAGAQGFAVAPFRTLWREWPSETTAC